jgi:hypothetical protein
LALCCQSGLDATADERPKRIERVEIASYITALGGALYQRVDRSLDLTAGTFIQLRGASNQRIHRRGDDLLGRNVVNEQQPAGSQRFPGVAWPQRSRALRPLAFPPQSDKPPREEHRVG